MALPVANDLREFLRTRRARIKPQDTGLPPQIGLRRVPGLRREEVALLAGVSAEYYERIERGRVKTVSTSVLDAIARVLRLDATERDHLYALVTPGRVKQTTAPAPRLRASLLRALVYAGTHPHDPQLADLVGDLAVRDPDFRQWWADHDVDLRDHGSKRYHHPVVGELELGYEAFTPVGEPELVFGLHTVEANSASAAALNLLASWSTATTTVRNYQL
jgi:transcriptional regulator with XRE-family HTH domain